MNRLYVVSATLAGADFRTAPTGRWEGLIVPTDRFASSVLAIAGPFTGSGPVLS